MAFQKITESESLYDNLDQMSVRELLEGINNEDRKVAIAVGREIPKIEKLNKLRKDEELAAGREIRIK